MWEIDGGFRINLDLVGKNGTANRQKSLSGLLREEFLQLFSIADKTVVLSF